MYVRYNVHILKYSIMNTQNILSITNARKNIFELAENVQKPGIHYTLTENGCPKVVMMSVDEFDSIMETMEIMSDPELMKDIKEAEEDFKKGDYVTLDELKREFGYYSAFAVADKGKRGYKVKKGKYGKRAGKK